MGTIYRDIDSFSGNDFETKLSNAINMCKDIPGGNSMVLMIPEGNYTVNDCIVIDNSQNYIIPFTLRGQPAGFNNKNRIYAPKGFLKIIQHNDDATFITIENISIYKTPRTDPNDPLATCIECDGRHIKLKGLCITGFDYGIKISGGYHLIENVTIHQCDCGIEVTPVGVTIQNCHINNCKDYGIKTLRGPLSNPNPSNALNIIGLIAESDDQTPTIAHIEINETDYVSITNSYIGDNSTTAIKNNGGTHVQIDNMLQSIGGPHRVIHQTSGSMKCSGFYYCPDKTLTGIRIEGGEVDFSDMKVDLTYSFIEVDNTSTLIKDKARIIMPESRFQNGYELSGTGGDGDTKPTSFDGMLIESGTNFIGLPKYALWGIDESSPTNIHIPGICYNFSFPTYMLQKLIYLHIGLEDVPNDVSVDIFFNGGTIVWPISNFLAEAINVVSCHRIRLKAGYKYLNLPIELTATPFQATIAAPLLQNQARNKVLTISYIFANNDNRFNIPVKWEEV